MCGVYLTVKCKWCARGKEGWQFRAVLPGACNVMTEHELPCPAFIVPTSACIQQSQELAPACSCCPEFYDIMLVPAVHMNPVWHLQL